jgi:hypothetical protein
LELLPVGALPLSPEWALALVAELVIAAALVLDAEPESLPARRAQRRCQAILQQGQ